MSTNGRVGTIALLAWLVAGTMGIGGQTDPPAPKPSTMQEVELVGLSLDNQVPSLLLKGKRDKRTVQILIGPAELLSIAVPLEGITPPRPLTHDLFLTLFGRLNVSLSRVVITDLRDDVYYASLHLTSAGTEIVLDARPSDAIALAVRAKTPVLVEDRVFDKSGTLAEPRGSRI